LLPEKLDGRENIGQILSSPFLRHGKDNDLFKFLKFFAETSAKRLSTRSTLVLLPKGRKNGAQESGRAERF